MADKSRIKVAVIEGDYAELCGLGLPLSLSLQLQSMNLRLSGALWSAKASASGFSVSLYWPTTSAAPVEKVRRKSKRKQAIVGTTTNSTPSALIQTTSSKPETVTPNEEHPSPKNAQLTPGSNSLNHSHQSAIMRSSDANSSSSISEDSSREPVDLTVCSNIQYAVKEGVHGVSYTDCVGEQGWTPVTGRKKKKIIPDYIKRRFPPDHQVHNQPSQESHESGSDETWMT